jgi:uncharacterized membrane protein YoaK (UPF0700 family)
MKARKTQKNAKSAINNQMKAISNVVRVLRTKQYSPLNLVRDIQKSYEKKAKRRTSKTGAIVGSLASGAILGAIGGLIFAPNKGQTTRKQIAKQFANINLG